MVDQLKGGIGGGYAFTLMFAIWNISADTTTVLHLLSGYGSFKVPARHVAHVVLVCGTSTTPLTAGTLDCKVRASTVVVPNTPQPRLTDTVQHATEVKRIGAAPIPANYTTDVVVVTSAAFAPALDVSVIVGLVLVPVENPGPPP